LIEKPFRPETRIVKQGGSPPVREHKADICVVGAGISGVSAAIEAARLGRNVILIDGLPALGGHRFVVVPKERETDARFPRRAGEPGRRPLG